MLLCRMVLTHFQFLPTVIRRRILQDMMYICSIGIYSIILYYNVICVVCSRVGIECTVFQSYVC